MQRQKKPVQRDLLARCLAAFIEAGTIDLSLDHLASRVGISKRMLIHYFGNRENIEVHAMVLLEERLRAQLAPELFPSHISAKAVLTILWERTTAAQARVILLLIMDISRRAWNGSVRAQEFYAGQQRQWVQLLKKYLPDQATVEEVLQLFQGAVLAYLITGDAAPGRRSLMRVLSRRGRAGKSRARRDSL